MSIRFVHNFLLQVSRSDGYKLNNFFALKLSTPHQLCLGPVVPNGVNALYTYKAPYTRPFSPVTDAHACTHAHTHPHTCSHRHTHTHTHVDIHARAHTHTHAKTRVCVGMYCMYVCD